MHSVFFFFFYLQTHHHWKNQQLLNHRLVHQSVFSVMFPRAMATLVTQFRVLITARVMEMSLSVDHLKWLLQLHLFLHLLLRLHFQVRLFLQLLHHLMKKIFTLMTHLMHLIHIQRVTCTNCLNILLLTATKFHFYSVKKADAYQLMIWTTSANAKMDSAVLFVSKVSNHLRLLKDQSSPLYCKRTKRRNSWDESRQEIDSWSILSPFPSFIPFLVGSFFFFFFFFLPTYTS